jgi:hypothetical protein
VYHHLIHQLAKSVEAIDRWLDKAEQLAAAKDISTPRSAT